jgi:oxygen-independent coproporphyrinogen III oxidase
MDRYVSALIREIEGVAWNLRPRTVFFGGGTPSLLNRAQWQRIFAALERLRLLGAAEWTVECNPATVSPDKARLWRDFGVNRISLGIQSLDDRLLNRLGRIHTRAMVFETYDLIRRAGFDNVNLDLMFAIPGQSPQDWQATLDEILLMESEHLSCYEVTYEDDTPLFAQLRAGAIRVDDDLACDMFERLCDRCADRGFAQYEVSNFAKQSRAPAFTSAEPALMSMAPTYACRHNINYWRGGVYYGLGPSAASYVGGVRSAHWADTVRYCEALEQGRPAIESSEELPPLQRAGEVAAFGLRMTEGWSFVEFERITGFDLRQTWAAEMGELVERGWADLSADAFRLNARGLRFADAAAALFLR